jgi:hypothetical protein
MKHGRFFKKADLVVIAVLLAAAAALFALRGGAKGALTARVSVNGETLYEIALNDVREPYDLTLPGGAVIRVEHGAAAFVSSPCRGQDCVRCGKLTRAGQMAACVPTKTLLYISGKPPAGAPDAISY